MLLANTIADTDPKQALLWLDKGRSLAINARLPNKELKLSIMSLRINNMQGAFLTTIRLSEALAEKIEKAELMDQAAYYMSIGNAFNKTGRYTEASNAFNRVFNLGREYKIPMLEVRASMNMGLVYESMQRYDDMRSHLLQAMRLAEQHGLVEDKMMITMNLAFAEGRMNNHGKSIEYIESVLPYYDSLGNKYALGLCYANKAWGLMKSGKYDAALVEARKSMHIRQSQNDKSGMARLHMIFSRSFLELGQYDSTIYHAQKGLEISTAGKIVVDIRDNYETLAMVYERKGDAAQALHYLKQHLVWKDSARKRDDEKTIDQQFAFFKTRYADSVSKANAFQVAGIHVGMSKSNFITTVLWTIIATSMIWLLLMLYAKRTSAKLLQQASLPQVPPSGTQSTAFTDTVALLQARELELKGMRDKLVYLESRLEMQTSKELEEMRHMIGSNKLHSEGYWNDFLLLFAKVHPDFFEKLKLRYPSLTQNEMRICALIKLNLSLLEISNALNITTESVRKARYRLYKKLNLASDQELVDSIITL